MRVLVTGATGFIGKSIINTLADQGHEIIALYRSRELPLNLLSKCRQVIRGDISEINFTDKVLRGIDAVCHLAAFIPEDFSDLSNAEKCYRVNALATLNLAMQSVASGVSRFIYVSTGNMYRFSKRVAFESDLVFPCAIATPYFVSKLAGEIYTAHVCQSSNLPYIILRIGTPYGPGEPQNKLITSFLTKASNGEELVVYHGGKPTYNFVYVEDVAACMASALIEGESGIYNVASGENTSLTELIQAIEMIGKKPLKVRIEEPSLNYPRGFSPISIEKAKRTWKFSPTDLKSGLRKYLEVIKNEKKIS